MRCAFSIGSCIPTSPCFLSSGSLFSPPSASSSARSPSRIFTPLCLPLTSQSLTLTRVSTSLQIPARICLRASHARQALAYAITTLGGAALWAVVAAITVVRFTLNNLYSEINNCLAMQGCCGAGKFCTGSGCCLTTEKSCGNKSCCPKNSTNCCTGIYLHSFVIYRLG